MAASWKYMSAAVTAFVFVAAYTPWGEPLDLYAVEGANGTVVGTYFAELQLKDPAGAGCYIFPVPETNTSDCFDLQESMAANGTSDGLKADWRDRDCGGDQVLLSMALVDDKPFILGDGKELDADLVEFSALVGVAWKTVAAVLQVAAPEPWGERFGSLCDMLSTASMWMVSALGVSDHCLKAADPFGRGLPELAEEAYYYNVARWAMKQLVPAFRYAQQVSYVLLVAVVVAALVGGVLVSNQCTRMAQAGVGQCSTTKVVVAVAVGLGLGFPLVVFLVAYFAAIQDGLVSADLVDKANGLLQLQPATQFIAWLCDGLIIPLWMGYRAVGEQDYEQGVELPAAEPLVSPATEGAHREHP